MEIISEPRKQEFWIATVALPQKSLSLTCRQHHERILPFAGMFLFFKFIFASTETQGADIILLDDFLTEAGVVLIYLFNQYKFL